MAGTEWVKRLASGHDMPARLKAAFSSHLATWAITIIAAFLGIWGSISSAEISSDVQRFLEALSGHTRWGRPSLPTVGFVLMATCVWPLLLYARLVAGKIEEQEQVRRIEGAIHRAPNRIVIDDYPEAFKQAAGVTAALESNGALAPPYDLEAIEGALRILLHFVAQMADKFNHKPQDGLTEGSAEEEIGRGR